MTARKTIYSILGVVFLASFVTYILVPHGELLQQIAAVPLIGSLVAALMQILRDQAAHERQLLIQAADQRFVLGASSHMAGVAFDKHVQFCEEYVQEVFATLDTLFREGPTEKAVPHSGNLFKLRRKYAVWLTKELDSNLERFESAVRSIGANDWYLRNVGAKDSQERINSMYKTFVNVLGAENMGGTVWQGQPLSPELAATNVVQGLRHVLGTEELTDLRSALVHASLVGIGRGELTERA